MGSLGDNLLKLTEFPFSYSFIGLLALIFGQGLNLDEPSLDTLGPLLILMGFVATTLSITDPIGALQKLFLSGFSFVENAREKGRALQISGFAMGRGFAGLDLSGTEEYKKSLRNFIHRYITSRNIFGHPLSMLSIIVVVSLTRDAQEIFKVSPKLQFKDEIKRLTFSRHLRLEIKPSELKKQYHLNQLERLSEIYSESLEYNIDYVEEIYQSISSLQKATLGTTWIVREIDKITAMGYFVIVVSLFISAELLLTGFLDKFLVNFPGGIAARIAILLFSIIALGTVLYKLYKRLSELRSKAWTTFRYLIEVETIKIEKTTFDRNLQSIEQYFNNGDWAMADYWVRRVMEEYSDLILKEWTSGWKNKIEGVTIGGDYVDIRDIDREEMLKKQGISGGIIKENEELPEKPEMNVEEDKDVQKKTSPEVGKNIVQKNEEKKKD
jgi:hypothetical protein